MPRARHGKLTDTFIFIESLSPQENGRERIVRDGAVPGFLVRISARIVKALGSPRGLA